ncbi:MAG: hypothetical protein NTW66_01705 [Candidatus Magasanikbacteria bacterium]|nr:hypothetical protein [Candidatus Magasanikbacteria bacterium]
MSSQQIDEMLTYVSQIMHQIEQGDIPAAEIELIVSLFAGLIKPESRAKVLRSLTRTIPTMPPASADAPDEGPITIESEKELIEQRGREETIAISTEPQDLPTYAAKIGIKPTGDTTYHMVGQGAHAGPHRGGLRAANLDEQTTKQRRVIDVRSLRGPGKD